MVTSANSVRRDLLGMEQSVEAGLLIKVSLVRPSGGADAWPLLALRKKALVDEIMKSVGLQITNFKTSALIAVEGPAHELVGVVDRLGNYEGLDFGLNERVVFPQEMNLGG